MSSKKDKPLGGGLSSDSSKLSDCMDNHVNDITDSPIQTGDHPEYKNTGHYWLGSVWAPTNHMIVKGLSANNRHQLAREIVCNHLDNILAVFRDTGTVWENYSPETAEPGNPAKPDFVGWSAVGPIAQLIENYIGITLDVPANTIHWNLLSPQEMGIRNIKFGDSPVEIICDRRNSIEDPVDITVETSKSFNLRINSGKKIETREIETGTRKFKTGV